MASPRRHRPTRRTHRLSVLSKNPTKCFALGEIAMSVGSQSVPTSKKMLWAGRILSGLVTVMILMSAVMKFMMTTDAQENLDHIGWNLPVVKTGLAVIEATCAIVYAIPQTAVLGAILLTGYLGGACA